MPPASFEAHQKSSRPGSRKQLRATAACCLKIVALHGTSLANEVGNRGDSQRALIMCRSVLGYWILVVDPETDVATEQMCNFTEMEYSS
jgi:hypothetical protein